MTKYLTVCTVSLLAFLILSCKEAKKDQLSESPENIKAKELLQGIWLDDETDIPLMYIKGDTIYYADSQSAPIAFKIIRDTLYTYGRDTTYRSEEHTSE